MASHTTTIERLGADALAPETQTPGAVRAVLAGLWQSLRQAPAFY